MHQFSLLLDSPFKLHRGASTHTVFATFAFISVVMVIIISSLGLSLVNSATLLQLYQTESLTGEIDIVMVSPQQWWVEGYQSRVNASKIDHALQTSVACRISLQVQVVSAKDDMWHTLMAIDFKTEESLSIGANFPWQVLASDEVLLPATLATQYSLKVGQTVTLRVDARDLSKHLMHLPAKENPPMMTVTFTIKGIISSSEGKFASNLLNRIFVIEQKNLPQLIKQQMAHLTEAQVQQLEKIRICEFCSEVLYNFPDRYQLYSSIKISRSKLDPDQIDVRYQATLKAQHIREILGDYQVELSLPVITELANWVYANQFAGIIFKAVLATLFFLSFLLVSNFITLLIDDKLTSIGILRVSGTSQRALIFFLAFQSLRLLLPAVLFGLFLSTLIQLVWPTFHTTYKTLGHILFNRFHYDYQINQYLQNLAISGIVGVLIPICSSLFPIRNAITVKLNDLFNQNQSKTKALKIDIYHDRHTQFQWGLLLFAGICITFGGALYIFLPMALFTYDFLWLLTFVGLILMGYLIGFILLSLNIQHVVERFMHMQNRLSSSIQQIRVIIHQPHLEFSGFEKPFSTSIAQSKNLLDVQHLHIIHCVPLDLPQHSPRELF